MIVFSLLLTKIVFITACILHHINYIYKIKQYKRANYDVTPLAYLECVLFLFDSWIIGALLEE